MREFVRQLLLIRVIRIAVGKLRFLYFTRIRRSLRVLESADAIDNTIKHNLKSLGSFGNRRMDTLIKPLSVLENVSKAARILVIGPRNEDDILNLVGNGFAAPNITGLDLISYSPAIQLGDMHNAPFADSTFDVIICGWTLSYSNQPAKFAAEAIRIIKDRGTIGIAVEYSTLSDEQSLQVHGGYHLKPTGFARINSTRQILDLFGGHVHHVFFDHDAPNRISHGDRIVGDVSNAVVIFTVTKH